MAKKYRKSLSFLLAATFVVSISMVAGKLYGYWKSDRAYEAARELALPAPVAAVPSYRDYVSPAGQVLKQDGGVELEEPYIPMEEAPSVAEEIPLGEEYSFLMDVDLQSLRKINQKVLGWIYIPDTPIDYPLMAYGNNSDGLNQNWDGTPSSAGSIFLERKNQRDFNDFNTLIYGHYMSSGTMFGSLKYYGDRDYLDRHPCIYIVTDSAVLRYTVFSAYEAPVSGDTYRLYFEDELRRQNALEYYIQSTSVETNVVPTVVDRILTLSTCMGNGTYSTRWVVQGVLDGEFPRK